MHRTWGKMRIGGYQPRMPYFRQNQGFQNPNYRNWSNQPFNPHGYQQEFRNFNRNYGHPYNNNPRRYDRKNTNINWIMNPDDCYVEPINHISNMQSRKRDQRSMSRERSVSPTQMETYYRKDHRNERFENDYCSAPSYSRPASSLSMRSNPSHCSKGILRNKTDVNCAIPVENSSSPPPLKKTRSMINGSLSPIQAFKRTIHNEPVKDKMEYQWSDSDSDGKDGKRSKRKELPSKLPKKEQALPTMIWNHKREEEEDKAVETYVKYNTSTLPKFDGKTVVGDEGVLESKVIHCTFCNILLRDKERSRRHMQTQFHYNKYKEFLVDLETTDKDKREI